MRAVRPPVQGRPSELGTEDAVGQGAAVCPWPGGGEDI